MIILVHIRNKKKIQKEKWKQCFCSVGFLMCYYSLLWCWHVLSLTLLYTRSHCVCINCCTLSLTPPRSTGCPLTWCSVALTKHTLTPLRPQHSTVAPQATQHCRVLENDKEAGKERSHLKRGGKKY